jgi:hypothetical protein
MGTLEGATLGPPRIKQFVVPMLSDTAVRTAKPKARLYRLWDERGLYLEVTPKGAKRWRFKYRFAGKGKRISLGLYPDVSLKKARDRREEPRRLVADGINPSEKRRAIKKAQMILSTQNFEAIAREWFQIWQNIH